MFCLNDLQVVLLMLYLPYLISVLTSCSADATSVLDSSLELFSLLNLPLFSCIVEKKSNTFVSVVVDVVVVAVVVEVVVVDVEVAVVSIDAIGTSVKKQKRSVEVTPTKRRLLKQP